MPGRISRHFNTAKFIVPETYGIPLSYSRKIDLAPGDWDGNLYPAQASIRKRGGAVNRDLRAPQKSPTAPPLLQRFGNGREAAFSR
jgi:hypothetical protein